MKRQKKKGLQRALAPEPVGIGMKNGRRGIFPVSVSLGVYRRGKGNGWRLEG
jgi:hypothetical protein